MLVKCFSAVAWAAFKERLTAVWPAGVVGPHEEEATMKLYHYVKDMPEWAREACTKAIRAGVVNMDAAGAVNVWECNLQPLVWMDRAGMLDLPVKK